MKAVIFTAKWCGPCKVLKPDLEKLKNEGYEIELLDVDTNMKKASALGVRNVPTALIYEGNEELSMRLVGKDLTIDSLIKVFK
jgi:thioredoxin 1